MPSPDSITCYQTQASPQRGSMHARCSWRASQISVKKLAHPCHAHVEALLHRLWLARRAAKHLLIDGSWSTPCRMEI